MRTPRQIGLRKAEARLLFLGPATSCHTLRWVRHLRGLGHEVLLATVHPRTGVDLPMVSLVGAPVEGHMPARLLPQAIASLRGVARTFQPDVTIAYYMTSYGLLAALSGLRPCIGAAAGGDVLVDEYDGPLKRLRSWFAARIAVHHCDRMLAWAPHVADRLVELGFARERVLVQPRGVDLATFRYRVPRLRLGRDALRILSLRWLKPLYRVDTLLAAIERLADRSLPCEVIIAGDGPERRHLEAVAAGIVGPVRITFVGRVKAERIPFLLKWADVYVSTSTTDGASASLFEALATGVYPVVSDIPPNREFVRDGETGRLFPVGDAEALAERLCELYRDDERRRRSVEAARHLVVTRFDFEMNMRRIDAYVLGSARPGAPAERERSRSAEGERGS
ncbi:MAG: glycosyltransferase [Acidobacteria bacterium]|nr:glycosyltransferase [Acidobacteriota bacterium]